MSNPGDSICLLVADDDADDRLMVQQALPEHPCKRGLRFVEDGEELLDYLHRRGKYASPAAALEPSLILLDLNMPRKDGREVLAEIKADPKLRHIPVVVLTTSAAEEDVLRSYDLGVNSYITKPASFQELTEALRVLSQFWFDIVQLPPGRPSQVKAT
jgi:CheY-like chemotaxis protein